MGSKPQDDLDYLFNDEDPHAIIEAQRRQDDESESDDDEGSDSTDELSKAIEQAGGFGSDSDNDDDDEEDDDEDKDIEAQEQHIDTQSADLDSSLSLDILNSSTPVPPKPTVDIIGAPAQEDEADSNQRLENVISHTPASAAPRTAPLDPLANPVRGRRSKKEARTLNLNGLQIRLDKNGVEIGYKETPPPEETYAWASDTPIMEDDPYSAKGCQRRMVFVSDSVPVDRQYRVEQSFVKRTGEVKFLSAVDKAYDWNRTRRGVIGATDETIRDGKIPRHFILKMGPPNGPNGDALRVAKRLKALVEHFFFARLAKSHLTIEIAISFHRLGAQSYYEKYMHIIRGVMENKKIRDRFTVHLEPESAQQYLDCEPKQFYPPKADHDTIWSIKARDPELVWTFVNQNEIDSMPRGWIPSREEIAMAKQQWLPNQKLNENDRQDHTDQAIKKVQDFVRFVHHFEIWRRDGALPPALGVTLSLASMQEARLSAPEPSVAAVQSNIFKDVQVTPSQQAAAPSDTSLPPSAPAPCSFSTPQQLNTFASTFYRASQPSELFRQPGPAPSLPNGARYDQYSSVTSFGTTPEQQDRNMAQVMAHQTREYHRRMQQGNAQALQQLRQQQQVFPAVSTSNSSASAAPLSSSGSVTRSDVVGQNSPTSSSLGKRMGKENEAEHVEKRPRQ